MGFASDLSSSSLSKYSCSHVFNPRPYFPVDQGYIDGGVCGEVNPVMCAVAQALDGRNEGKYRSQLPDLFVLSVGTGRVPTYIDGSSLDWGLAKWAPYLVDLSQEAPADMADYECRQILGERYYRVQPTLSRAVALDDPKESGFLEEVAREEEIKEMIDGVASWVEKAKFFLLNRADKSRRFGRKNKVNPELARIRTRIF